MQVLFLVVKFRLRYDLWFGVLASSVETSFWARAVRSGSSDKRMDLARTNLLR